MSMIIVSSWPDPREGGRGASHQFAAGALFNLSDCLITDPSAISREMTVYGMYGVVTVKRAYVVYNNTSTRWR